MLSCNMGRKKRTTKDVNEQLLSEGRNFQLISEYMGASVKAWFKCDQPDHPKWKTLPAAPLHKKSGCPACSDQRWTSVEVNQHLLNLNSGVVMIEEYKGIMAPTKFKCTVNSDHVEWVTAPNSILNHGTGCPSCAERGYNSSLPGWLYVIGNESFIKYGITNYPDKRMNNHKWTIGKFETFFLRRYEDGIVPQDLERLIRKTYGGKYVSKEVMSNGYTETLSIDLLESVINTIDNYSKV